MRTKLTVIGAAAGLLLLAGCGSAVPQGEVEDTVAGSLEGLVGVPPNVDCPDGLEAEVGAEMTCIVSLDDEPEEFEVYLTVTDVDGGEAHFDIEVAEEPLG